MKEVLHDELEPEEPQQPTVETADKEDEQQQQDAEQEDKQHPARRSSRTRLTVQRAALIEMATSHNNNSSSEG